MKKRVKRLLRPFWNLSAPVRRKLGAKVENWFFARIEPRARRLSADIVPGLDGVLRELQGLQDELDALQAALAHARRASAPAERAKAG